MLIYMNHKCLVTYLRCALCQLRRYITVQFSCRFALMSRNNILKSLKTHKVQPAVSRLCTLYLSTESIFSFHPRHSWELLCSASKVQSVWAPKGNFLVTSTWQKKILHINLYCFGFSPNNFWFTLTAGRYVPASNPHCMLPVQCQNETNKQTKRTLWSI